MKTLASLAWFATALAFCIWGAVMILDLEKSTEELMLSTVQLEKEVAAFELEIVRRHHAIAEIQANHRCENVENQ